MKIQIASDLHLEFLEHQFPGYRVIEPAPNADVLVLAGDIHQHAKALAIFADWPVPVLYVTGNHEAYGAHLSGLLDNLRIDCQGTRVTVLERREVELMGVRFLGTTLWTDYNLTGSPKKAMDCAGSCLNDHRLIQTSQGIFTPEDALARHRVDRAWLAACLNAPFDGKTVVVTHHGPHRDSVHPRYQGDLLNGAFNSHLPELVEQADLWIHGHVHDSHDYQVGKCRVVVNPRGYALDRRYAENVSHLRWENPAFNPSLVIEV